MMQVELMAFVWKTSSKNHLISFDLPTSPRRLHLLERRGTRSLRMLLCFGSGLDEGRSQHLGTL